MNPERHQLNPGDIRDSTGRVGAAIPTGTGDSVGLGGWRGEVTLFDTVCFVGFFLGEEVGGCFKGSASCWV